MNLIITAEEGKPIEAVLFDKDYGLKKAYYNNVYELTQAEDAKLKKLKAWFTSFIIITIIALIILKYVKLLSWSKYSPLLFSHHKYNYKYNIYGANINKNNHLDNLDNNILFKKWLLVN